MKRRKNVQNEVIFRNKGQMGKIAELVLILAAAIVLYLFISQVTSKSTFDQAIHTCRFSVVAQASTEKVLTTSGKKSPFNINCETRYIDFYNTKVELGLIPTNMQTRPINVEGKTMNKFKTLTDFTVDQVVAEELRICKYEFADGKEDIFANNDYILNGNDVCFICSQIRFVDIKPQRTFDTLLEYTNKTTFDESRITYYDYLTENTMFDIPMWMQPYAEKTEPYANLKLDSTKSYSIIVEKYSPAKWKKTPIPVLLAMAKVSNLFISAEDKVPISIIIIPSSEINHYCDIQAN